MNTHDPVIVALTERGAALGRRIAAALDGARLDALASRVAQRDQAFTDTLAHLRALFVAERPIIGICASGILVRALAPLLADKSAEPPVIAVAEDGSAVVPLLGGHQGANALAEAVASELGVRAALTTATDTRFGLALDAPPAGWRLANPHDYKAFAAEALAGKAVQVHGEAPWLESADFVRASTGPLRISATLARRSGSRSHLVYHPRQIALGVGSERGVDSRELIDLVEDALVEADLSPACVAGVFSLDLKCDEAAVHALATHLGVAARFFDAATLERETPRLATPSEVVFREVGCHGVSEGAALAAVGDTGSLLRAKRKSKRATCAIAVAQAPLDAALIGRPRGHLSVVGVGPGTSAFRIPAADDAISHAQHVVGYRLYLELVEELLGHGQRLHPYGLGEETERVRAAIALASEGARVALVCSGDAGIYAMASLVYEQLEHATAEPQGASWQRVAVDVVPGISALQAAAALAGAPIGHDFCAVSLSDLLTPWPVIERRLTAAGSGDFVIALYNPISTQRRATFESAMAIIRAHREPDTPVILGRNLGREGERVDVITLEQLVPERVDMLTVVLIGSSTTRALTLGGAQRAYTPRGYADKPRVVPSS